MRPEYQAYWKKNLQIIVSLLVIWILVSVVGSIIFAEPLSKVSFFGISFSFWLAQQGSIIIFVCIIFYYAVRMGKLDREVNSEIVETKDESRGLSQ